MGTVRNCLFADGKGRGSGKTTVPGRRVRKQIGIERSTDAESAGRLKSLKRRLGKLDSHNVAELLVEDALEGELTPMLLLLRILGCLDDADAEGEPDRFARVGRPRRNSESGELAS